MWNFECNKWHMVITNSVQNIKERCKTGAGANTNLKIGSRIRRYGGMSIYCWPVKSAVYFLSQLGKRKNPYTRLYRWSWLKAYWVYIECFRKDDSEINCTPYDYFLYTVTLQHNYMYLIKKTRTKNVFIFHLTICLFVG